MQETTTCPRCQASIPAGVHYCPNCGAPAVPPQPENAPPIKNYMTEAILVTLFCCLPFGVVAIINASQVEGHQRSGNYHAALTAADTAAKYVRWSLLSWVALVAVYLVAILGLVCFRVMR